MVIISDIDDNSPIGEVFGKLFDAIVSIASESDVVTVDNENINNKLFNACLEFYCANRGIKVLSNHILNYVFDVDATNVKYAEDSLNGFLKGLEISNFNPIEYFVDEMMCNIKEHSRAGKGLLYYWHSTSKNTIDICVADNGISILGSCMEMCTCCREQAC